jgi:hypothetical protein
LAICCCVSGIRNCLFRLLISGLSSAPLSLSNPVPRLQVDLFYCPQNPQNNAEGWCGFVVARRTRRITQKDGVVLLPALAVLALSQIEVSLAEWEHAELRRRNKPRSTRRMHKAHRGDNLILCELCENLSGLCCSFFILALFCCSQNSQKNAEGLDG